VSLASFTKHLEEKDWEGESNPSDKSNKRTQMILSQVSKKLSWFWILEWIECFDCVFGVFAFALAMNVKFRKLGWLEWRWLAVFIAPTTILAVVVDGTPDSPVVHQTWHGSLSSVCHVSCPLGFGAVDRWSLLSFCCTRHVWCVLTSLLWLLTFALCAFYCSRSRPLAHLTVASLAHWTYLVHTGQSSEL
jgi:hypothetical protein